VTIGDVGFSSLLHVGLAAGLCLLAVQQVPPNPEPLPEASIEVMFGHNAAADVPTVAPTPREPRGHGHSAAAPRLATGGVAGLDFARGDPALIEATADPGNRAPDYPGPAQASGESGLVVTRIAVDSDGRVDHLVVMHSSGFTDLDNAARTALLRWHFVPAQRHEAAVASSIDVTVDFVLDARK